MFREAGSYARTAWGLHKWLRAPLPNYQGLIRRQLENREEIFLDTVRKVVFANPDHPYHHMFRSASCGYKDLAEAVKRDGLEAALETIRRAGVYLTHDEFKGKTPIVRSARQIPAREDSFQNPLVSGLIGTSSSGSRGKRTPTRGNTQFHLNTEAHAFLAFQEFALDGRDTMAVLPILPSAGAFVLGLLLTRFGKQPGPWFTAGGRWGDPAHSTQYRLATLAMVAFARLLGARLSFPFWLAPNDFAPAAEWIARRRAEGVPCAMAAFVSPAVRVAAAALDRGLDIRGTLFFVFGEALTDAKRSVMESAGAHVFSIYAISELGPVGFGCRQMTSGNCVHLFRDSLAVIGHRRPAPLIGTEVNSLLFTTLLPFAPHFLINAEMDDCGVIEPARCDCLLSRAGFTGCIRDIASFGKLTGHGITLVGSDVVRILEEALPARFGGIPGDYQLVEHEGASQTQLTLRISPRVRISSPDAVRACFLDELRNCYGGTLASRLWEHAGGLRAASAEPIATASGKVLSLHLLGPGVQTVRDEAHVS